MRKRKLLILLSAGAVLMGAYLLAGECARLGWRNLNEPDLSRFESVRRGMSEERVTGILGKPTDAIEKGAGPDYYYRGYAHEERQITNRVLVYFGGLDLIAYVYIDPSGKVEHVFIGGS